MGHLIKNVQIHLAVDLWYIIKKYLRTFALKRLLRVTLIHQKWKILFAPVKNDIAAYLKKANIDLKKKSGNPHFGN